MAIYACAAQTGCCYREHPIAEKNETDTTTDSYGTTDERAEGRGDENVHPAEASRQESGRPCRSKGHTCSADAFSAAQRIGEPVRHCERSRGAVKRPDATTYSGYRAGNDDVGDHRCRGDPRSSRARSYGDLGPLLGECGARCARRADGKECHLYACAQGMPIDCRELRFYRKICCVVGS